MEYYTCECEKSQCTDMNGYRVEFVKKTDNPEQLINILPTPVSSCETYREKAKNDIGELATKIYVKVNG